MSFSAVTQHVLIDLKPVVSINEKMKELEEVLSEIEGFEEVYWGHNVDALEQVEILLREYPN
jgi:hypothetical protein